MTGQTKIIVGRVIWLALMVGWYIFGIIFFIQMFQQGYGWVTLLWQFPLRYALWSVPLGIVECLVLHKNLHAECKSDDYRYNSEKHTKTMWVENQGRDVYIDGEKFHVKESGGQYVTVWDKQNSAVGLMILFVLFSTVIFPIDFFIQLVITFKGY